MKKFIAVVCILALAFSMSSIAFAATEPSTIAVGIDDVNEDLYASKEIKLASGISMQIPEDFETVTDGNTTTITGGEGTIVIALEAPGESKYASLADAKKAFIDAGLQNAVVEMTINGAQALGVVTEDGTYMLLIEAPDGRMIVFTCPGFDTASEEYRAWIENMIKTIVIA